MHIANHLAFSANIHSLPCTEGKRRNIATKSFVSRYF